MRRGHQLRGIMPCALRRGARHDHDVTMSRVRPAGNCGQGRAAGAPPLHHPPLPIASLRPDPRIGYAYARRPATGPPSPRVKLQPLMLWRGGAAPAAYNRPPPRPGQARTTSRRNFVLSFQDLRWLARRGGNGGHPAWPAGNSGNDTGKTAAQRKPAGVASGGGGGGTADGDKWGSLMMTHRAVFCSSSSPLNDARGPKSSRHSHEPLQVSMERSKMAPMCPT